MLRSLVRLSRRLSGYRSAMSSPTSTPVASATSAAASVSTQSSPTISVDKPRSLVDERIGIHLCRLPSNAPVTVRLQIRESYGSFSAFGHYVADSDGALSLATSDSVGGTYKGVDGMGLFWSLQQDPSEKSGLRLLRREAAIPMRYQLTAFAGHVTWEQLTGTAGSQSLAGGALCTASLERTYLDESVERIPINFGRLRGSLFKPRSHRSCPPIIDLFGTGGGLMEHRAALLAKEGFSVLALAYFNYADLPRSLTVLDMEYFEEAVDFMLTSPYSRVPAGSGGGGGVGLIGVSTGADIVANSAILFGEKVRATVWINGSFCHSWYPVSYRGRRLPHQFPLDIGLVTTSPRPPGLSFRAACCPGCTPDRELPVELATCQFLFFSCLDDYSVAPESGARLAERLRLAGRSNFDHVTYPDAGHLLEPPISPCTALCYHGVFGVMMDYGGAPRQHHLAQVDSWTRLIRLFRDAFAGCDNADDGGTLTLPDKAKL